MVLDLSTFDFSKDQKPVTTTPKVPVSTETTTLDLSKFDFSKDIKPEVIKPTTQQRIGLPTSPQSIGPATKEKSAGGLIPEKSQELLKNVVSPISGFIHGLTGLRTQIGAETDANAIYSRLTPEERLHWDKKWGKPNPTGISENKTLSGIGDLAGTLFGITNISKLATSGAIKVATKSPEIAAGVKAGVEHLFSKNLISHIWGPQAIKLLTPLAIGVGGQKALTESVNEIYDKGYIDPKIVGEEAAAQAALVYLFAGAGSLLPRILGKSASLAPHLLRFIPASLGGMAGIPREAIESVTGRIKPMLSPVYLWEGAAKGLRAMFSAGQKVLPKVISEHLQGINTLGKLMDGLLRVGSSSWEFPTHQFRGAGTFPPNSALRPQILLQLLDMAPSWIRNPTGNAPTQERAFLQNLAGGRTGAIFHNILADQLDRLSIQMKGSTHAGEKANAYRAAYIAKMLRRKAGVSSIPAYDYMIKQFDNLIGIPQSRFRTTISNKYGQKVPTPTQEGDFLIFLRDLFLMQRNRNEPVAVAARFARSMTSHVLLGLGNFASGITVLNRLSFPLATEGPENVFYGLNEVRGNTALYQRFVKLLGIQRAHRLLAVGEDIKESLLSKYSFTFYDRAERAMLPATALARFKTLTDKGVPYAKAVNQAVDFARQLRTSMDYDLPQIMRGGRLATAARIGFQFFPFAFKSAQFAGSLGIEEFGNYVGYMMMLGGIKAIPFATVADRAIALYTGHSIMNSMLANPVMQQILTGIPGLEFGVDLGSRHNWTQALVDRGLGMQAPPFLSISNRIFSAYSDLVTNPNGANAIKAFKASLSLGFEAVTKALDDEKHGAILDTHGFPIVKKPTQQELTAEALGFIPSRVSEMRALQTGEYEAGQFARKKAGSLEDTYRRALQSGNSKEIADATKQAIKGGVSHATLLRIRQLLKKAPAQRMLQRVPKRMRDQFTWLTQQLDKVNK